MTINTATTLTLSGGWAGDFGTQDLVTMPIVLQAAVDLPVVTILANGITIAFTVDGLTIQGGKNLPAVLVFTPCQMGSGGGICARVVAGGSLSLALSRVVLQRNLANGSGGGLEALGFDLGSSLNLTVTDSTVTRNAAPQGGGIHFDADDKGAVDATFDQVVFTRNRAGKVHRSPLFLPDGGGLGVLIPAPAERSRPGSEQYLREQSRHPVRLTGYGNVGGYGGGINTFNAGCQMGSCPLKVVNSVFTHNRAIAGGGISVGGGAAIVGGGAELVNVTATRNGGGGVFIDGATDSGTVLNTVLWGNRGPRPRDLRVFRGGVGLDHSDILDQGVDQGATVTDLGGNISDDPLFVSASDIHLSSSSPCIDSGTCTGAPTTDFEGDPRPTGASCDMGADEFVP